MKLVDLSSSNSLVNLERFVNQPKYSAFANYSEAEERFNPRSFKAGNFGVPFELRKDLETVYANPSKSLVASIENEKGTKFFSHPQINSKKIDGTIKVAATASTRTVLTLDESQNFFLKLHFPKRISRFNRRLTRSSIKHSIGISMELECAAATAPKSFSFLPESIGAISKNDNYGFIVREAIPRPIAKEKSILIPLFSLYSKDQLNPNDEPLLVQLINNSGDDAFEFFINRIAKPFLANWSWFALNRGILLESHCQNTLLELDEKFEPTRLVYRDFQSIMVNQQVRSSNNLDNHFEKHLIGGKDDAFSKEQEYSIVYDHFVASYVFPYFEECLNKYFSIERKKVRSNIRELFRESFPNQFDFFPKTEFTLTDNICENNSIEVVDTNAKPRYR